MEKHTYKYEGPIYHNGHKIAAKSNMITTATSIKKAEQNFLYRIANGDYTSHYDIVPNQIKEIVNTQNNIQISNKTCPICGHSLNPLGECPICDLYEYDLED